MNFLRTAFGKLELQPTPEANVVIGKICKLDATWERAKHTCGRSLYKADACKACVKAAEKMPALPTWHPRAFLYPLPASVLFEYCGDMATAYRISDAMKARDPYEQAKAKSAA